MRTPFAHTFTALALCAVFPLAAAQSIADLRNDAATGGDVTTYGMGWAQQRHSPLNQVDASNATQLQAVWNLSLDNSANASSQPLVIDGVMYVATHTHTIAVDAVTGRQKWKTLVELPADITGSPAVKSSVLPATAPSRSGGSRLAWMRSADETNCRVQ